MLLCDTYADDKLVLRALSVVALHTLSAHTKYTFTHLSSMLGASKRIGSLYDVGSMGDDCLNLNIVTPLRCVDGSCQKNVRLPVLVWIHGGNTL